MRKHSSIDLITNSSSSVFIYPPDQNKLDLVAKQLGLQRIKVSLSKNWVFKNDDIVESYFKENDLDFKDYLENKEKYYEQINSDFLNGSLIISKWVSEEDAVYKDYIEDELEIVLVCQDGSTKNLSNIIEYIRFCFERE